MNSVYFVKLFGCSIVLLTVKVDVLSEISYLTLLTLTIN